MADVVNTNMAAIRIAKNRITVWPNTGNMRAATGSGGAPASWMLTVRTVIAAAPMKNMATKSTPLTSCRLDCRTLWRRTEAADHIRSATMNHKKAIPAKGMMYSPMVTGREPPPAP